MIKIIAAITVMVGITALFGIILYAVKQIDKN